MMDSLGEHLSDLDAVLKDRCDIAYDNEGLDVNLDALNELFGSEALDLGLYDQTQAKQQPGKTPSPYSHSPGQPTHTPNPRNILQLPDSPPYSGSEQYSPSDSNKQLSPSNCSDVSSQMTNQPGPSTAPQYQDPREMEARRLMNQQQLQQAINEQHLQRQMHLQKLQQQQQLQQPHMFQPGTGVPVVARIAAPQPVPVVPEPDLHPQPYCVETNSPFPPSKKRRYPPGEVENPSSSPHQHVKQEPVNVTPSEYEADNSTIDISPSMLVGGSYQPIKWSPFQHTVWSPVVRSHGTYTTPVPIRTYKLDGDKGFNFSTSDKAFVCQKKNHFQITACFSLTDRPQFVMSPNGPIKLDDNSLFLHFYGVKEEAPNQPIQVDQSQADRSKKRFTPVPLPWNAENTWKITVGRLHFSDTTLNNMRKRGKPNPDQRYFLLVVGVFAHCNGKEYPIVQQCSEKLIVRASNPGQFQDNETTEPVKWQPGQTPNSVHHSGKVGINTDTPDEALTVAGNVKVMGHIVQPSDKRVKEDITEADTKEQLDNVRQINLYNYKYTEEFANAAGLDDPHCIETGVIAQELEIIIPEAVKTTGDVVMENGEVIENLKVVDKNRLFMESLGAVKELCNVTDSLETKITHLEKFNKKLARHKRLGSVKSVGSADTDLSRVTSIRSSISHVKYTTSFKEKPPSYTSKPTSKSVCSSRFLQVLIMTLVVVMIICVGIIIALLIMDNNLNTSNGSSSTQSHSLFGAGRDTTTLLSTGPPVDPADEFAIKCPAYDTMLWGKNCYFPNYERSEGCSIRTCTNLCAGFVDFKWFEGPSNGTTRSSTEAPAMPESPFTIQLNSTAAPDGSVIHYENRPVRVKRSLASVGDPLERIRITLQSPVVYDIQPSLCADCHCEGADCTRYSYNYIVQVHSTFVQSNGNILIAARPGVDGDSLRIAHCNQTHGIKLCENEVDSDLSRDQVFHTVAPRSLLSPSLYPAIIGEYEKTAITFRLTDNTSPPADFCNAELSPDLIEIKVWFYRICTDCPNAIEVIKSYITVP